MTFTKYIAPIALAVALIACGSPDVAPLPEGTVGVRITAEIKTDVSAERITVIPNNVAPWLSQILVLSEGQVYRTSVDGGKAQKVNAGNAKDMLGLMRKGKAGTALILTRDGKLTALIEKDDEGRLARMNVSAKAATYDGFCQSPNAPVDTLMAFAGKNLITLNVSYDGDEVMRIAETERSSVSKPVTACYNGAENTLAVAGGQLYSGSTAVSAIDGVTSLAAVSGAASPITLMTKSDSSFVTAKMAAPKKVRTIVIEDGLSVLGTDKVKAVFATGDSLGGTFSDGAVIAQDGKSARLLMVNKSFAQRALSKQPKKR